MALSLEVPCQGSWCRCQTYPTWAPRGRLPSQASNIYRPSCKDYCTRHGARFKKNDLLNAKFKLFQKTALWRETTFNVFSSAGHCEKAFRQIYQQAKKYVFVVVNIKYLNVLRFYLKQTYLFGMISQFKNSFSSKQLVSFCTLLRLCSTFLYFNKIQIRIENAILN